MEPTTSARRTGTGFSPEIETFEIELEDGTKILSHGDWLLA